jgi:type I restriction enzyme M protein
MVDASKGFVKDGNKNRLRPRDVHKIVDVVTKQIDVDHYSRMVPLSEIQSAANDFNLNITRYIDSSEPEDVQDLDAHLNGGIPDRDLDELAAYWKAFPSLRSSLFKPLRAGYSELAVEPGDVRAEITGSSEYQGFADDVADQIARWWTRHRERLELITASTRPVDLIDDISEDLLVRFIKRPLIDEYGVYERLMQYWNSVMHDDVTMVVGEGWVEASRPREARIVGTTSAGKPKYEDAHIVFGTGAKAERWVMDLIPPHLIIDRYFSAEKAAIEKIELDVETATQAIADFAEEHVAEGGLLFDAADDEGKVTQKLANERLRAARREDVDADELEALKKVIELFKAETAAKSALKEAQEALALAAFKRYGELSEDDVKTLVLEDKWYASAVALVEEEVTGLTSTLVGRLSALGRRYASTLGELQSSADQLNQRVLTHLESMGVS